MPTDARLRHERFAAILFDAGGTLVRLDYAFIAERVRIRGATLSAEALARGEAAARHEVDRRARVASGRLERDVHRIGDYFASLLSEAGAEPEVVALIVPELEAAHAADNLRRVPIDGARQTLAGLRERGLRTAVVSNADGRVAAVLRAVGLAPHLEFVIDSHDEGVEKPDPEIFRRALTRLGLAAERVAYVGDIYSIDVIGSRAAGLQPVVIDTTGAYGELDCPSVRDLRELL